MLKAASFGASSGCRERSAFPSALVASRASPFARLRLGTTWQRARDSVTDSHALAADFQIACSLRACHADAKDPYVARARAAADSSG